MMYRCLEYFKKVLGLAKYPEYNDAETEADRVARNAAYEELHDDIGSHIKTLRSTTIELHEKNDRLGQLLSDIQDNPKLGVNGLNCQRQARPAHELHVRR